MPKIKNLALLADEAGAEDDIGPALENGLEQTRVISRIVFEVGVLENRDVARHFGNGAADGGSFSSIARLAEEADLRMLIGEALGDLPTGVGGMVVDKHN